MNRPLIAILRGITPPEAVDIGESLVEAGIDRIEVPLNSPDAFASIAALVDAYGDYATIGAGTVLDPADVDQIAGVGGRMVVSPNCDAEVIRATKAAGLESFPGVLTPTECFAALRTGADALKVFPAFLMGPEGLKAIRAVLPLETQIYMVGGVGPTGFAEWKAAGASGFGLGSSLYKPGDTAEAVSVKARETVTAWDVAAR